ncbi:MAG TPA: hypothetical protein PLE93_00270 [Solirubrobacterales bacterium]|nr:hypothetical protein [Solirubrobacterales bacterium]
MAEISTVEEKLAEVTGLAQAAQGAIEKVAPMIDDESVSESLEKMKQEAVETEERCTSAIEKRDGRKTAILDKARETKQEATEMMSTYLGDDSDGLDGLEFMTMAEAGEVGHWEILGELSQRAGESELEELTGWALPIQERHLAEVRKGSLTLASQEDIE